MDSVRPALIVWYHDRDTISDYVFQFGFIREITMKIDMTLAIQSLQDYRDGDISGIALSQTLNQVATSAEALEKKHEVSFKYYVGFFEKEGEQWYLDSNKYLKEEVEELSQFLDSLTVT